MDWDSWLGEARAVREGFATLLKVDAHCVGIGHTTSTLVGIVAHHLPDGACVLVPEHEHNANTIPFLGHQHRGVRLECVPLEALAESLEPRHSVVAFSLVQSFDGRIADVAAIRNAANATGTLVCVDATQAAGWLAFDAAACDFIFASSYKWLMGPNGPAFVVIRPDLIDQYRPLLPNSFACGDPAAAPYGTDFHWASDARRFDVVPGLVSCSALAPSLDLLNRLGIPSIQAHNLRLAARVRERLNQPETRSAIVTFTRPGAGEQLRRAGVSATIRGDRARLAFHLYNSEADVDLVLSALDA